VTLSLVAINRGESGIRSFKMMTRIPVDMFFTYAAMPLAFAGAFALWVAWKVTEKVNRGTQKAQAAD
jgi:hypothetical protein